MNINGLVGVFYGIYVGDEVVWIRSSSRDEGSSEKLGFFLEGGLVGFVEMGVRRKEILRMILEF